MRLQPLVVVFQKWSPPPPKKNLIQIIWNVVRQHIFESMIQRVSSFQQKKKKNGIHLNFFPILKSLKRQKNMAAFTIEKKAKQTQKDISMQMSTRGSWWLLNASNYWSPRIETFKTSKWDTHAPEKKRNKSIRDTRESQKKKTFVMYLEFLDLKNIKIKGRWSTRDCVPFFFEQKKW